MQGAELRVPLAEGPKHALVHQHEVSRGRQTLGDVEVRVRAQRHPLVVVVGSEDAFLIEVVERDRERGEFIASGDAHRLIDQRRILIDQPEPVRVRVFDRVNPHHRAIDVTGGVLRRLAGVHIDLIDRLELGANVDPLRQVLGFLLGDVAVVGDSEITGVPAAASLDEHHPVRRARPIDRRRRGVLEHRDALDVEGVEVVDLPNDAVDENERAVVAERPHPTDPNLRAVRTGTASEVPHGDARHVALKTLRDVRDRTLGDLLTGHDFGRTGDGGFRLRTVAGRDHALELHRRPREVKVQPRRIAGIHHYRMLLGAVAEEARPDGVCPRSNSEQPVTASLAAPRRGDGSAIHADARADNRHARGVRNSAGDDPCSLSQSN